MCFFVGDAAAATDPMTGEGIAQALHTGILAAEAIAKTTNPVAARGIYVHRVERALFADHRMSMMLMAVLRRPRGADLALRTAGLNAWTRRNFARWLFEDYPRAILVTPRRWR